MNTTANPAQNQQGDVLLLKVDRLPAGSRLVKRSQNGVILAESQTTNNRHFVLDQAARLFVAPDGKHYLVNEGDEAVTLQHSKDHAPIVLEPGVHRVGFVQERDHFANITRAAID